jgi:hypothetical protein
VKHADRLDSRHQRLLDDNVRPQIAAEGMAFVNDGTFLLVDARDSAGPHPPGFFFVPSWLRGF